MFGSNLTADIAGASIANGATPDIGLIWAPSPQVWEVHGATSFDPIDPRSGSAVDVVQMDLNGGEANPTITFATAASVALQLNSLLIGHANDMTEPANSWTLRIKEVGGSQVLTHTTAVLGAGDTETIAFNFTGDPGVDYILEFDDNGAGHVRGAIDNLSFNQVVWPNHSFALVENAAPLLVAAHRGDSINAPENTLASINIIPDGVADLTEFDVRETLDGVLVLMHDQWVKRTTDAESGALADLTLAEAQALDAGSWFSPEFAGEQVPTMEAAINAAIAKGIEPLIERKTGAAAVYHAEFTAQALSPDTFRVISFDAGFLAALDALNPDYRLGLLGREVITQELIDQAKASGADFLSWRYTEIDASIVDLVYANGLDLIVWTVNDAHEMQEMIDLEVGGITTKYPSLLRSLLP